MADKRNILPPPMNPQEKPITVAVLSGKLDALFNNVKELVDSTAKRTENVLRKEMREMGTRLDAKIDGVEKRLDEKIDGVEKRLDEKIDGVEKRLDEKIDGAEKRLDQKINGLRVELSEKMDKVINRIDPHETRLSAVEEKIETHLVAHA